ncbi:hypothetical protein J2X92_001326 [Variovorax paradoxus]|nr:hypothetical protein [Variovorax paradoxus]
MSDSRVSKRTDIEPAQKHNAPVERGQARKSRLHPSAMYGITPSSDGRSWCVSLTREGVHLYKTFSFTSTTVKKRH